MRVNRSATKIQYMHWLIGRNVMLRCFELWMNGRMARIRMDKIKAMTPPSLLGIDRRMA